MIRKLFLILLVLLVSCAVGKETVPTTPTVNVPEPTKQLDNTYNAANSILDAVGVTIQWEDPESNFAKKAVELNKWLVLWFHFKDCEVCQLMEKTTFRDIAIINTLNTYFIPVKFDIEKYSAEFYYFGMRAFKDEMAITPTTTFVSPQGVAIVVRGLIGPEKFAYVLNSILANNGLQESASKY